MQHLKSNLQWNGRHLFCISQLDLVIIFLSCYVKDWKLLYTFCFSKTTVCFGTSIMLWIRNTIETVLKCYIFNELKLIYEVIWLIIRLFINSYSELVFYIKTFSEISYYDFSTSSKNLISVVSDWSYQNQLMSIKITCNKLLVGY